MTSPRHIRRLLVANRGEIAHRVFRTARALGIQTVAVHSDADADAPFVRAADRAVRLPGVTSAETYLDGDRIIAAALASGADAVHPGYGFLSENPTFARAVVDAGLTWVGPTPESIEAMALKVQAKRIAASAGVPLVPGCDLPTGMTDEQVLFACARVGYPLIIKASAGGGGKGMRVVADPDDLIDAVAIARREARSAFGDDTVFAERYLAGARHVEVQVIGDEHGAAMHLFERECSIQRRHQKVIEEAPSPGVAPAVRVRLHEAAVSLAKQIHYVGVGTVEFMVAGQGEEKEFFFLEMNTRLQVEHPVTEEITGLDLVALQLAVAQGERLPLRPADVQVTGHAIEARLYAEDPAHDHRPGTGVIHRFDVRGTGLRVDAGVADGSVITTHYDPMIAKVIAHGATRQEAAARLADGLARMVLHGPVTNRDMLVAILRDPAFLAGDTTTAFLDEHPEVCAPVPDPDDEHRHALAVARSVRAGEAPDDAVPVGWRNVAAVPERITLQRRGSDAVLTLVLDDRRGALAAGMSVTEEIPYARMFALPIEPLPDATVRSRVGTGGEAVVTAGISGVEADCRVARYGDEIFVDDGLCSTSWTIAPRFPDHSAETTGHGAVTPVPGTITAVHVAVGDVVAAGTVLVILGAMKMEHRILAEADGVVGRVLVEVGQSVDAHALVVEFDEPSAAEGGHDGSEDA